MSKDNADLVMQVALDSGISDHRELANFMGQMQVESGNFNNFEENLRYRPEHFLETFRGHNGLSTLDQARVIIAGTPKTVAEAAYGGHWGAIRLGNTESGDGYAYRGRGFTQLTGRNNYRDIGDHLGLDLVNHPDDAAKPEIAAKIAIDFWKTNVVSNGHQQDVYWATHDINKAFNALAAREKAAAEWEHKLDAGYRPGLPDPTIGDAEADRRRVQQGLKDLGYADAHGRPLVVDGHYGHDTKAALERFQRDHHLTPDGIAGPHTRDAIAASVRNQTTVTAPLSPDDQAAIDRSLWKVAGTSVPPAANPAAEYWQAVAARAPTPTPTAPSVIPQATAGPTLRQG